MAKVVWNKTNLATLRRYGKDGLFEDVAKILKCSVNAARLKYGRIKKAPGKPLFKALTVQKAGQKNPFEISQQAYTGIRASNEIVLLLVKQMLNIKPNKLDSISVPLSVADSKRAASNIFQQAKNYLARTDKNEMVFTIKSTFSVDKNKSYLGARIWRLK